MKEAFSILIATAKLLILGALLLFLISFILKSKILASIIGLIIVTPLCMAILKGERLSSVGEYLKRVNLSTLSYWSVWLVVFVVATAISVLTLIIVENTFFNFLIFSITYATAYSVATPLLFSIATQHTGKRLSLWDLMLVFATMLVLGVAESAYATIGKQSGLLAIAGSFTLCLVFMLTFAGQAAIILQCQTDSK